MKTCPEKSHIVKYLYQHGPSKSLKMIECFVEHSSERSTISKMDKVFRWLDVIDILLERKKEISRDSEGQLRLTKLGEKVCNLCNIKEKKA